MEEWKAIPGYEGYYEVSNEGRVKGLKRNKILKCAVVNGFTIVHLHRDGMYNPCYVQRLVMLAFKPDLDSSIFRVRHINGINTDNRVENLEWIKPKRSFGYTKGYDLDPKPISKKYYEEHFDRIQSYNKKYYEEHKEKMKQYFKDYYINHKEEILERIRSKKDKSE
jgi:hypothetical protein